MLYPYNLSIFKTVATMAVVATEIEVRVFVSGTAVPKDVFQDRDGQTPFEQPLITDGVDGAVSFFTAPGRIRVEARIDSVTVKKIEAVISAGDNVGIFQPVTTEERDALELQTGLVVFNTTDDQVEMWDGVDWRVISIT